MKNIKKLIAILLVATLSYPNLVVHGDSLNRNEVNNSVQQEITEETSKEGEEESLNNQETDKEESQEGGTEQESPTDSEQENVTDSDQENVTDSEVEETPEETESNSEEVVEESSEVVEQGTEGKAHMRGAVYNKVKLGELLPNNYSIYQGEEELPQEVIEKRKAMLEYEVLVPMTEAAFEIALAYGDGSYTYLSSCNTMEEAVEEIEALRDDYDNYTVIPVAISDDGQVAYSTNSMGRMLQHRDGVAQGNAVSVTEVYSDPGMKNAYTYISMDYVDDLPIMEDNGVTAKVRVNGYDGWIHRDVTTGNYEMVVMPINQVTNPSFYYVQNGILYHYITTNMKGTPVGVNDTAGNRLRLGVAPSYLNPNTKYYSYDGNYFYQGSNTLEGLDKLVNDLKGNTTVNAVNPNNPYYNYYQYLPFRTRSNFTAEELDKFINENTKSTSKLRGIGSYLIQAQEQYGVNPLITLGVAINESAWGDSSISQSKNNLFGLNAVDSDPSGQATTFTHPGESVIEFAKNYISRGYADPADWRYYGGYVGNKALGANVKYASDPFWGEKASRHAFTVDLTISGGNINTLRDYNGYQLAKFTGTTEVRNSSGTLLYSVAPSVVTTGKGAFKDNIVALKFTEGTGTGTYQIFSERTTAIGNGGSANKYHGNYNWNDNGYVNTSSLQLINTPKNCFIPGYAIEDTNKNGAVGTEDLDDTAGLYNQQRGTGSYKDYKDINQDGIIDLFDLVNISKKLN